MKLQKLSEAVLTGALPQPHYPLYRDTETKGTNTVIHSMALLLL